MRVIQQRSCFRFDFSIRETSCTRFKIGIPFGHLNTPYFHIYKRNPNFTFERRAIPPFLMEFRYSLSRSIALLQRQQKSAHDLVHPISRLEVSRDAWNDVRGHVTPFQVTFDSTLFISCRQHRVSQRFRELFAPESSRARASRVYFDARSCAVNVALLARIRLASFRASVRRNMSRVRNPGHDRRGQQRTMAPSSYR